MPARLRSRRIRREAPIEALLERESQFRLIVVDPNVRPAVFGDRDAYRRRFEHWASFAHVIKLSDADAEWLYPGECPEAVLDALLERGVRLAVVTLGADGAFAKTRACSVEVDAPGVEVVDTVGAGDAFGAGLLRWLWANDRLDAEAVGNLSGQALTEALGFAAAVGALQCSRAGATPSTLAEVEALLDAPMFCVSSDEHRRVAARRRVRRGNRAARCSRSSEGVDFPGGPSVWSPSRTGNTSLAKTPRPRLRVRPPKYPHVTLA